MPRVKHRRSSRRVPPPKDSDFDHEINLVDHYASSSTSSQEDDSSRTSSRGNASAIAGPSSKPPQQPPDTTDAAGRRGDGEPERPRSTNRTESQSATTSGPSVHVEGEVILTVARRVELPLTTTQDQHRSQMSANKTLTKSQGLKPRNPSHPKPPSISSMKTSGEVSSAAWPSFRPRR